MDTEQFWIACYKTSTLIRLGAEPPPEHAEGPVLMPERSETEPTSARHLLWMLDNAASFHAANRSEKANRWLGYVQGVLVAKGWATLDQCKQANMPDGAAFDGERV
jgi:hypothetical protein